jgi:hypothetical protein
MNPSDKKPLNHAAPLNYRIQVKGHLPERWSVWFDGMQIQIEGDPSGQKITTLSGEVQDQAALHGLLERIRDLGLELLNVQKEDA